MSDTPSRPVPFSGAWPALLTPLDDRLDIEHSRLASHAKALLLAGCGGVTLFGTTGEGPSFSLAERQEALQQMIARGVPAERIIVSTSCAALPETLALTQHAVQSGVHGCLMLPPFFMKGVSDAGIEACYRQVIDAVGPRGWRLYLYHIPQVAGVGLSHALIARLLEAYPEVIAGIKDSACERAHSVALAARFMPPMKVYVGNEPDLRTLGRLGSTGAISGLANFMPRTVTRLVGAPDGPGVDALEQKVLALLATLKPYALIPAFKHLMATFDGDEGWRRVRAPLVGLDAGEQAALSAALAPLALNPALD